MSFNWKEYVVFAEDTLKGSGEACLRSSISRAYYGIFCIARNRAGHKLFTDHRTVIKDYKNSHHIDERNIGTILDDLRRERNFADYDESKQIDRRHAERAVFKAKKALSLMGIH